MNLFEAFLHDLQRILLIRIYIGVRQERHFAQLMKLRMLKLPKHTFRNVTGVF
jgi:hypothetical protein